MHRIDSVQTRPEYRIWIRFTDGLEGEIDLSDLVGKGVFASWSDKRNFEAAFVDTETGTVAWPGGIDLAPDALYQDLVTKKRTLVRD
jgi:hypothetical protein